MLPRRATYVPQDVAKAEAALIIAAICARFDLSLAPDQVKRTKKTTAKTHKHTQRSDLSYSSISYQVPGYTIGCDEDLRLMLCFAGSVKKFMMGTVLT